MAVLGGFLVRFQSNNLLQFISIVQFQYAIGGSDGQTPLNTVERYDPRQNKWSLVAPMSTRRKHLGCAVYNNFIYAGKLFNHYLLFFFLKFYTDLKIFPTVGGRDDCMELSSAERYNPQTNSWSPIVAMTSRRSGVGLAVVNGALYAVRFKK